MAGPASDYHRGEMDISEQTSTFHLVMALTKWGSLATAVAVLFLTLLFCTKTGFLGSAFVAVVATAIGVLVLRERPGGGH
ncbi:aa3-type cytochrome c oxidase subunit IV [Phenylobacterium terrae]|uniref:Aa3-type cytochrome c oxidase subunit IV n=1 Tax=Phenylobacterium terrae TaxID=2665495 RepID=A0ABW4N225_9CAUL